MSVSVTFIHKALPWIVFPALASAAVHYIAIKGVLASGLNARMVTLCSSQKELLYRQPYTGIAELDAGICQLVGTLLTGLEESSEPFFVHFLAGVPAVSVIPFIEAARDGQKRSMVIPAFISVTYQFIPFGIIMPLYSLLFLVTGSAYTHQGSPAAAAPNTGRVEQAYAHAIVFSLFVGYSIPTTFFAVSKDPGVTLIWQFFPILMLLAQGIHYLARPKQATFRNGHTTVQAAFLITGLFSAAAHIGIAWPRWNDPTALYHLFSPFTTENGLTIAVHKMLNWDAIFGFGATMVSSLWFARSVGELFALLAWNLLVTVLFGPGAAIAGAFMWRESILEGNWKVAQVKSLKKES